MPRAKTVHERTEVQAFHSDASVHLRGVFELVDGGIAQENEGGVMAKSNVQKFEVGDQVPANWFEASAPATVTYGGDVSFKFKADGGRYVTADLGTLPAVMSFSVYRKDRR